MNDVIELDSLSRVYEILEFLFCNLLSIEEIYATSYGELSEWRDADSWWGGNYLRIHDTAFKRGAKITRTVIFDSEKEKEAAQDVLDGNLDHKVIVKTALVRHIVSSDLERVGNCLIFLDSKKQPIYCLLATHNREGKFVRALIYRDQEHMKLILDAYNRIDGIAAFYQGGLKPVPTTTKLSQ